MKTVEIVTAQKVDISYTLAGLMQRILAFIIDVVAKGILSTIIFTFIGFVAPNSFDGQMIWAYFLIIPIVIFYDLVLEFFWQGQTLGKKALGIRVIKASGERPEFVDYFMRWMFRTVDISFSAGLVAVIAILSTEKRQRLGDVIANTAVIQVQDARNYNLKDVMNIMKLENYEVTYPDAKFFNEQQMLLVKETLERSNKYNNEAHLKSVRVLALKVAEELGIAKPNNPKRFLKLVLRDYIYLTR